MIKFSWIEVEEAVIKLGEAVRASGFVPDYAIGIMSGGLIPLYLISKELDVEGLLTLRARSYDKHNQKEIVISELPNAELEGKNILLVDEVAETGATLQKVSEILKDGFHPGEIKTLTLGINTAECLFTPNYFAIAENGWIVFPWEKKDFPEYF